MVAGIDSFKEWFHGYENHYTIIGGTACDLLMSSEGLDFRMTKDIDLVLIIEVIDAEFGRRFWDYVIAAGYKHRNKSTGRQQFYRFIDPQSEAYPYMIELFTKKPETIILPEDAKLMPLPVDEDVSSLSAILLDDDYYGFLKQGRTQIYGMTVLDTLYLIPFKAKAWIDLTDRKNSGEQIDRNKITKHKRDVFRLTELLNRNQAPMPNLPGAIREDMRSFCERMQAEDIDLKQLKIRGKTKNEILEQLEYIYR